MLGYLDLPIWDYSCISIFDFFAYSQMTKETFVSSPRSHPHSTIDSG